MSATGTPARPTVARKRPRYLGPTNAAFKSLSRMGVRVGVVQVLTVPGRASGQPRSTPVSPVPLDGRRFIVAPMPQGDWARNARAAGRRELAAGRKTEQVLLRELDYSGEADLRRRVMAAFPAAVPHGVRMVKALGLVTSADPAEFAAAADRVTAFEVRARLGQDLAAVFALFTDGVLRPQIAARLPLSRIREAIELAESHTIVGKVVLVP